MRAALRQRLGASLARERGDEGMTLVEVLIASSVLVMLMTLVMVSMTTFMNGTASVSAQYQEYDTILPAFSTVRPLIQAEVEPGPADSSGAPLPGFGIDPTSGVGTVSGIGNYSLTFFSNVGNSTLGPAKIVAGLTNAAGALVTPSATTCTVKSQCYFQVQQYLPKPGTCPGVTSGTVCQYASTYKLVTDVAHVVNTSSQPVFSYIIFDPIYNNTFVLTAANITAQSFSISSLSADYGSLSTALLSTCKKASTWASGTDTLAVNCPADAIQRVGIDLQVKAPGNTNTNPTESSSLVYRDQGNSTSPQLPYQYTASVG